MLEVSEKLGPRLRSEVTYEDGSDGHHAVPSLKVVKTAGLGELDTS